MKLKHILMTTDLTRESQRPLGPVGDLAMLAGARVTLLHAIPVLSPPWQGGRRDIPRVPPDYKADNRKAEAALKEIADSMPSGLEVAVRVLTSTNVAGTIARFAAEHEVDLVTLSTHGRSGIRRFLLGCVSENVLRRTCVPVLCFPQREGKCEPLNIEHILLTTDLSEEALRPFEPVLELAKSTASRVTVLHVVPESQVISPGMPPTPPLSASERRALVDEARSTLADQCSSFAGDVDLELQVISEGTPAKAISEYARAHEVDLIALSTHGRTGLRRFTLGSVAEHVLRHSSTPVLSFHREED